MKTWQPKNSDLIILIICTLTIILILGILKIVDGKAIEYLLVAVLAIIGSYVKKV